MFSEKKKLILIARVVLVAFLLVELRFFYLQTFKSSELQEKVTEQRVKEIVDVPERGKIIDRNGNVLAMSLMAQNIAVYPNLITSEKRQQQIAELLSDTLEMDYKEVLKKIQTKDKDGNPVQWVSIAKRVDPEKAYIIKKKNIGGIEITQSPKRYYPNGSLASSIIGFVNNDSEPGAGIEVGMNSYLSGVKGYTIAETDNLGKIIPIGFENVSSPVDGQNAQLTIDNYIQYVLEQRLEKGYKEMKANSIHGVVMDPKTGEILAMASYPSFDPNEYGKSDSKTWTNSPATFVYEPGSTFKPNFMANALELGTITGSSTWYDGKGSINVNGSNIKNFDGRALGEMTLEDIIINSSNVGMIDIANTMTSQQILDGLKKVGFGQKTGVEYPGEEIGLFPNASTDKQDTNSLLNDPIRKATLSFGQGISVTPVQLITAFSSLVNGGYKVNAQLVNNVTDKNGNVLYEHEEAEKTRVYSNNTVSLMKSYLAANMEEGSGENYQIEGYDGGGKTGSAWVVDSKTGAYKDGEIIGSFMGFAPLDDPEVVTLIVVDQPEGIEFGGPSAGPIFHDVMTEIMRYKNVAKKNEEKTTELSVPDTSWMLYEDAKALLKEKFPNATIKQDGTGETVVNQQYSYKKKKLTITLETKKIVDGNTVYMPSFKGKEKEEIQDMLKKYDLSVTFHGNGEAKDQSINPGENSKKKKLSIWLQ